MSCAQHFHDGPICPYCTEASRRSIQASQDRLEPMPERVPSLYERLETRHIAAEVEQAPRGAPLTEVELELADPDLAKLENWFSYHAPTPDQVEAYQQLRDGAYMFARCILLHCPASADRTAALRKLRESVMTANASIACGGK
jgi:hypothetical protein